MLLRYEGIQEGPYFGLHMMLRYAPQFVGIANCGDRNCEDHKLWGSRIVGITKLWGSHILGIKNYGDKKLWGSEIVVEKLWG